MTKRAPGSMPTEIATGGIVSDATRDAIRNFARDISRQAMQEAWDRTIGKRTKTRGKRRR